MAGYVSYLRGRPLDLSVTLSLPQFPMHFTTVGVLAYNLLSMLPQFSSRGRRGQTTNIHSFAILAWSSPRLERGLLIFSNLLICYGFAFFVYVVPTVSGTRQMQIIVKSPEGGTTTVAVGETHGNVNGCLSKSTPKGVEQYTRQSAQLA